MSQPYRLALPLAFAMVLLPAVPRRAAAEDPAEKKVELKKGDRIIFFGDSLTALAGMEKPPEHVSKGYVRIVRETLAETHKDKNIDVLWVATGGHTVPDLLKRVDKDVIAKKPTIVVIQIGCNDARRIPKDLFRSSLGELIDRLQKAIFVGSVTTVVVWKLDRISRGQRDGVNLLAGQSLQVVFNVNRTSSLVLQGVTFNSAGLGISQSANNFQTNTSLANAAKGALQG